MLKPWTESKHWIQRLYGKYYSMLLDPNLSDLLSKLDDDEVREMWDAIIYDFDRGDELRDAELRGQLLRFGTEFREKPSIVDVSLVDVKSQFDAPSPNKYKIGKLLSFGGYGSVYEAQSESDSHVAKVMLLKPERKVSGSQPCLTQREQIRLEFAIATLMSDLGIGPMVHEATIDEKKGEAVLIMDRYDSDLKTLFDGITDTPDYQTLLAAYNERIQFLITAMHQAGVVHRDIKYKNILYRVVNGNPDIRLTDFGLSLFSTNPTLQRIDFEALSTNPAQILKPLVLRNGQPCYLPS